MDALEKPALELDRKLPAPSRQLSGLRNALVLERPDYCRGLIVLSLWNPLTNGWPTLVFGTLHF